MSDATILDRLAPVTAFNKGGASKVLERAAELGPVFVLKNNAAAGSSSCPRSTRACPR